MYILQLVRDRMHQLVNMNVLHRDNLLLAVLAITNV